MEITHQMPERTTFLKGINPDLMIIDEEVSQHEEYGPQLVLP